MKLKKFQSSFLKRNVASNLKNPHILMADLEFQSSFLKKNVASERSGSLLPPLMFQSSFLKRNVASPRCIPFQIQHTKFQSSFLKRNVASKIVVNAQSVLKVSILVPKKERCVTVYMRNTREMSFKFQSSFLKRNVASPKSPHLELSPCKCFNPRS